MYYKSRNLFFCWGVAFLINALAASIAGAATATTTAQPATQVTPDTAIGIELKQTETVNVNLADLATLQQVKGMSKRKAQAIIDYRTKNGPFKSLEELLKVNCRGIHKNWLDKVSKFLVV